MEMLGDFFLCFISFYLLCFSIIPRFSYTQYAKQGYTLVSAHMNNAVTISDYIV